MAKQEVIDGTSREVVAYDVPVGDLEVGVDFSDDLEKEEADIASIQVTTDILGLVQGVKIARIEREGLWRQGNWDNLRAYRISQAERLKLPSSTLSTRRTWGEAWIDYNAILRKLPMKGNVSKLTYFDEAMRTRPPKDVIAHFKADSFRAWAAWVHPALPAPSLPDIDVRVRGDTLFIDDEEALTFGPAMTAERRKLFGELAKGAAKAWEGNCIAHVVPCYDEGEARAVDNFLKKLRVEK